MSRPLYETSADFKNEQEIISDFEVAWKCKALKLPRAYSLDFALEKAGSIFAFAEVKDRPRYSWQKFIELGGYNMSLHKWVAAKNFSLSMGLPFVLIVRASGETRYIRVNGVNTLNARIIWGGRRDRADSQDVEPMVQIDAILFRRL